MPRALILLLLLLLPQSAGWMLAGCGSATGGCAGQRGTDPATSACCCASADQPSSEACCDDPAPVDSRCAASTCATPGEGLTCSPCGSARCDPRACLGLVRGLPLLRAEETRPKTIAAGESRVAHASPAWAALVLARVGVSRGAIGAGPTPPPESASARRARLCIWTI